MTLLPGPVFVSLADPAALALALVPAFAAPLGDAGVSANGKSPVLQFSGTAPPRTAAPLDGEAAAEEDAAGSAKGKSPVLMFSRTAQPHEAEAEVEEQQAVGSESANETRVELLFSGTVPPPPLPQPKEKAPGRGGRSRRRKKDVAAIRLAWRALGLSR